MKTSYIQPTTTIMSVRAFSTLLTSGGGSTPDFSIRSNTGVNFGGDGACIDLGV